jgi:predicted transposase/invertase (TIGR01784 family)
MMDKTNKNIQPDGLPKILPPSEDGIFQAILTLPESYKALLSAVSAFLDRQLKSVTLRNNVPSSREALAKQEEFDINCVVDGENGDQCEVEMQASHMVGDNLLNEHRNIKWRSVFNVCDIHSNQPGCNKEYSEFVRSYQVTICNYRVFNYKNELAERFTMRNARGEVLCDAITIIFIDLSQAKEIAKKPVADMTDIEKWTVFFALADKPKYNKIITEITKTMEGIAVANDTLLHISQNPDERVRFHQRRKKMQDEEHKHAVWTNEVRAEYEPLLANKDAEIADKDAEIANNKAEIADKDKLIAQLLAKLKKSDENEV